MEEFVAYLATRIKALRQERGWTQIQMVKEFGYHLSHWQNIESGRKMSLETMLRVANTFDISLEELIAGIKRHKGSGFGCKDFQQEAVDQHEIKTVRNRSIKEGVSQRRPPKSAR